MVVVCILGLLAGVAIPTLSSFQDEQKLIAAAAELATTLRFAASESNRTKTPLRCEILPASETYRLKIHATGALIFHPIDKLPFQASFTGGSPYSGVDIATVNGSTLAASLVFNTRGTLAADTTLVLRYANHSRTIVIQSATGQIVVN